VRELVTMGEAEMSLLWQEMSESTACHGVVARTANMIMGDDPKTAKGVISSVQRHLNWLDDVPMRRVTSTSTFDLNELKLGHLSVYTILPPAYLQSHRAWMRLIMGCSLLVMTRHKGRPAAGYDTLFLMDEFAQLGRIERIVSDYTLLRGYGVKFWMVVQDFSQLEAAYGDVWTAFVSNAGALQVFQVNDNKTAKYLEERFGDMTIMTETENEGSSGKAFDFMKNNNDGFSRGEAGRKLMFASEIMQMPRDQQLVMVQGQQPVKARKVKYYEDAEFEGLYTPNTIDAKATA
jgi:type IV secretion system protein VirD4